MPRYNEPPTAEEQQQWSPGDDEPDPKMSEIPDQIDMASPDELHDWLREAVAEISAKDAEIERLRGDLQRVFELCGFNYKSERDIQIVIDRITSWNAERIELGGEAITPITGPGYE